MQTSKRNCRLFLSLVNKFAWTFDLIIFACIIQEFLRMQLHLSMQVSKEKATFICWIIFYMLSRLHMCTEISETEERRVQQYL
jgi:hypothetical protein